MPIFLRCNVIQKVSYAIHLYTDTGMRGVSARVRPILNDG
jgi:hypothetical protein